MLQPTVSSFSLFFIATKRHGVYSCTGNLRTLLFALLAVCVDDDDVIMFYCHFLSEEAYVATLHDYLLMTACWLLARYVSGRGIRGKGGVCVPYGGGAQFLGG